MSVEFLFKKKLDHLPFLLLDGAVGTQLERSGYTSKKKTWTALVSLDDPALLLKVHSTYIDAGCDIITSHTFRTSPRAMPKRWYEALRVSVQIAKKAIGDSERDVLLAGSVAPLEDCYLPDLAPDFQTCYTEHSAMIATLDQARVDFIIGETFNSHRETAAFCQAAYDQRVPYFISLITNEHGDLLSGESLDELLSAISEYEPMCVLINCRSLDLIGAGIDRLSPVWPGMKGLYANGPGVPDAPTGWITKGEDPVGSYLSHAKKWVQSGFQVIGGCCGTTPEQIEAIGTWRSSSIAANYTN